MDEQMPNNTRRPLKGKIQPQSKLLISFIVSLIWSLLTHGRPSSSNIDLQFTHVDTTLQHIFQTTIAIERKRFTKRIIEHSQGYWSLIPYVNQPRWIDLEIYLTTRIGFDLRQGTASVNQYGKIEVSVIQPTVLDKTWSTQIIDKSDNLINKWDIREYKQKENQVLEAIAYAESMSLLEQFKNSPQKMSDLSRRLQHKLQLTDSIFDRPMQWIDGVNAMVKNKLAQLSKSIMRRPEPTTYNSNDYRQQYQAKQAGIKPASSKREPSKIKQQKKTVYTEQQQRIRQQMKDTLNL